MEVVKNRKTTLKKITLSGEQTIPDQISVPIYQSAGEHASCAVLQELFMIDIKAFIKEKLLCIIVYERYWQRNLNIGGTK